MLWLALYFPALPLEVFTHGDRSASQAAAHGPPVGEPMTAAAICAGRHILLANAAAQAAGIAPGMPRARAQACQPELRLYERDQARELAAFEALARWALRFTPSVCAPRAPSQSTAPGRTEHYGLLLEVAPSLRLFGGLHSLIVRIRDEIAQHGYRTSLAVAPAATGAWLLARHRDGILIENTDALQEAVDAAPVRLLASAASRQAVLEAIGIRKIGDLASLPRSSIARRFGPALLEEIDRARGLRPEAHSWLQARTRYSDRLELPCATEHIAMILSAAHRLFGKLCRWLAARQAAVSGYMLELCHDDDRRSTVSIALADPGREADRFADVLRERLASLRLDAPVEALELYCDEILPMPAQNAGLLPSTASARRNFGRLLEKLQARLGRDGVRRLDLVADHRPEIAWCSAPLISSAEVARTPGNRSPEMSEAGTLPRPLWLLHPPLPLREHHGRPWRETPLVLLAGPERIETGWWDQALVQRDYFIAEDAGHTLYWIYRERSTAAPAGPGWFIQGLFG